MSHTGGQLRPIFELADRSVATSAQECPDDPTSMIMINTQRVHLAEL